MEPRTLPKGPCEAQQAPEERHSVSDEAHSALSEAQVARTPIFSRVSGRPAAPCPSMPRVLRMLPKGAGTLLLNRYILTLYPSPY